MHGSSDFAATRGDRFEAKRPNDSDLFKSKEPFSGETQKQVDFRGGKGERYDSKRPEASDIWKVKVFEYIVSLEL